LEDHLFHQVEHTILSNPYYQTMFEEKRDHDLSVMSLTRNLFLRICAHKELKRTEAMCLR
jgi:hypothetical protein